MSADIDVVFFYGMPVDVDLVDDDLYELFNESDGPLEHMSLTPCEGGNNMLYVSDSYRTHERALVKLGDVTGKEAEWRQLFIDACLTHGLTFVEPDWYFATIFS